LLLLFSFDFAWFLVSVVGPDLVNEFVFLDPSLDFPVCPDGVLALSHLHEVALETQWPVALLEFFKFVFSLIHLF
jgi:hypothetical protein